MLLYFYVKALNLMQIYLSKSLSLQTRTNNIAFLLQFCLEVSFSKLNEDYLNVFLL